MIKIALLISLGMTPADAQRLVIYTHAAGWLYSVDPAELLGIASAESTLGLDRRRSHKGACGMMGVLGSRYGSAPCWAMEAFVWLAVLEGAKRLRYFTDHCGEWALPAYNGAWTNCCGGSYYRKRKADGRVWRCSTSYRARVRAFARRVTRRKQFDTLPP